MYKLNTFYYIIDSKGQLFFNLIMLLTHLFIILLIISLLISKSVEKRIYKNDR